MVVSSSVCAKSPYCCVMVVALAVIGTAADNVKTVIIVNKVDKISLLLLYNYSND